MRRHALARAVIVLGLLAAAAGCTPPPDTALAVRNDSGETFYIRLEGAGGIAPLTYRVDPGATGRAFAPGERKPATRLVVYSAGCDTIVEESDPHLGSMDIDGAGSMSFEVGMTRTEFRWPALPTDATCG